MPQVMRVRSALSGWVGSPGLSTFYFRRSDPATAAEALEAAKRVRAYFAQVAGQLWSSVTVDVNESVDVLDEGTGALVGGFSVAAQTNVAGTGGTTILPPATQLVGQLLTGAIIGGRRLRGRTYLGACALGVAGTNGEPTGAALSSFLTGLGLLGTQITTPLDNVVWHRPVAGAGGVAAIASGYGTFARFGVLRSRRD